MRLRRVIAVAVACGTALGCAAPAAAAQNPVVQDCLQHRAGLTGQYPVAELRHALSVMPPATQEYTSCPDVINRALLAAVKLQRTGGPGGSGAFLPVPVLIVLAALVLTMAGFGAQGLRISRRGDTPRGAD